MSTNVRVAGVLSLSALLVAALSLSVFAAPRGGGGRSHGGPGGGGSGHVSHGGSGGGGSGMNIGGGHGPGSGLFGGMPGNVHSGGGPGVGGAKHGGGAAGKPGLPGGLNAWNHGPGSANPSGRHGPPSNLGLHGNPSVTNHGWNYGNGYHHNDWNHHQAWWNHHGPNWVGWWQVGIGSPGFVVGWWPGYYGSYAYYDVAPYYGDVYVDYYADTTPYAAAYPADETVDAEPTAYGDAGDMMDFYPMALDAFKGGDYRNATRLAGHASIDDPRNPDVHLLLTLGLFALGEYRGAASEAHAVASLGKMPDWAKVYGVYGKVEPYTEQLRALEKYVEKNPKAAEGRFLLGFLYLMSDHKKAARGELLKALELTPKDSLAARLLTEAGGTAPKGVAEPLAPPTPPTPNAGD